MQAIGAGEDSTKPGFMGFGASGACRLKTSSVKRVAGRRPMKRAIHTVLCALLAVFMLTACTGCVLNGIHEAGRTSSADAVMATGGEVLIPNEALKALRTNPSANFDLSAIAAYAERAFVTVNDGKAYFGKLDVQPGSYEEFAELDSSGRCGSAFALIGPESMPTIQRGAIGDVRPSGWKIAKYDWVEGKYLYNRCHLIAYQLTGQNANPLNLITGTRYLNVEGMEPLEDRVASYLRRTGNHVLYRVTPVFSGNELVARGVLMEARSVEDDGAGLEFCCWCYNVQPGVTIDYATGESHADGTIEAPVQEADAYGTNAGDTQANEHAGDGAQTTDAIEVIKPFAPEDASETNEYAYILNINSHLFHKPDCPSVGKMSSRNKRGFNRSREEAIELEFSPCGYCKP